jgi:NAD(P)H-hydrate epimerase
MKVVRVEQMRTLDKTATKKYSITQELLMENAGLAVCDVIRMKTGIHGKRFLIFCGAGNNGGDGLVVARKIHSSGGIVQVIILGDPNKYTGSARLNLDIIRKIGLPVRLLDHPEILQDFLLNYDMIVDAILGAGLDRDVTGIYRDAIEWCNNQGKPVISVDLPSGINGDTGQIMGTAVRADYTVTFGLPKIGNILYPGFEYCGMLNLSYISFPLDLQAKDEPDIAISQPAPLPRRPGNIHKGNCGKALFIAGAVNYYGAPYFAAMSFLKAGGGVSFLATPDVVAPQIATLGREIIYSPLKSTAAGSLSQDNLTSLLDLSQQADIVIIGPGMTLQEETQNLIREFSRRCQKPLLIDGDGLTAITGYPEILQQRTAPTVLTPHKAEMSRLTGQEMPAIEHHCIGIAQDTARSQNSIIALKGAHTLVALPNGNIFINLSGNAGMATAGSGDVLTGTIAAAFGHGLPIEEAVKCGVFLHGLAGDLAATSIGEDGVTAGNILSELPNAVRQYRNDYHRFVNKYYGKITIL